MVERMTEEGTAVFLASHDAAFITAHTLVIDGGRTNYLSHSD
jgi:NAD(P)-dependent dehydrogenase (short-subunit alcohol dehydrogenase family)